MKVQAYVSLLTLLRCDLLYPNRELPLLLIASAEREHFNSSLDTLFLDFLGEVLSAHLHNLLRN